MNTSPVLNADLHCHSVVSDGTLSPEALAERAHLNGVQLWSLTDHDELGGQVRAQAAAAILGIDYVAGVEISITWLDHTVHIVGLGIDPNHPGLIEGLRQTRDGRRNRAQAMAEQLAKVGIKGSFEGAQLYAGNPELISRTHFARFLVEQGFCKDTETVFKNYLVAGKPGYVQHRWATLENAVQWIRSAGGVAVIAHPGRYHLTPLQMTELYAQFKDLGGLGIEVVTGSHSPDQYQTFAKIAVDYGFMGSRGSDFHDPRESHTDLGLLPNLPSSLKPIWSVFH